MKKAGIVAIATAGTLGIAAAGVALRKHMTREDDTVSPKWEITCIGKHAPYDFGDMHWYSDVDANAIFMSVEAPQGLRFEVRDGGDSLFVIGAGDGAKYGDSLVESTALYDLCITGGDVSVIQEIRLRYCTKNGDPLHVYVVPRSEPKAS